jgi:GNAT superfamily N-acetyltransferase
MQPLTIVPADPKDAALLASLIDAAYAAAHRRVPDLPDVSGGIADDIAERVVLVAWSGPSPVGVAIWGLDGSAAHLANIAVHPDSAGQGIGKALIAAVEQGARAAGADRIDLATHVGLPENVALYGHLGWRESGREGNKVYMTKALS